MIQTQPLTATLHRSDAAFPPAGRTLPVQPAAPVAKDHGTASEQAAARPASAFASRRAEAPSGWRGWLTPVLGTVVLSLILAAITNALVLSAGAASAGAGERLTWPVIIHIATVVPALALGLYLLVASNKGSTVHKRLGRLWCGLMATTAVVALFIHSFGGWSPIHLFSAFTLYGLWRSVRCARLGDIAAHQRAVRSVYIGACIAGLFTFLPGRLMHLWLTL